MATAPDHIVVVVEENHPYNTIIGSSAAPYINSLANGGALFTNYQAITNPSEPNYFAMFSGSTWGVTDDGTYSLNHPTLAGQLKAAGLSFGGYAESGSPLRHNPWQSFADSRDTAKNFGNDFPATNFSSLPTVSFVSPNLVHDMHDGSIQQGDAWLKQNLDSYAQWAKTHNSLLIVTFDEGSKTGDNHIPTIVYGAGVTPGHYGQAANHYTLLHTIESDYGLAPLANAAGTDVLHFGSGATAPAPQDPPPPTTSRDPSPTQSGTILGTAGADQLHGGNGADTIAGLGGNDAITGNGGSDRLLGGGGADRLWASTGSDTLNGGAGHDLLIGGTDGQGDRFVFKARGDSGTGAARDAIHNFTHGADHIDLRGIDAQPGSNADNAFDWSGRTAAAHSVWWEATNSGVVLHADVTGDTHADFELLLVGANTLGSGDLLL